MNERDEEIADALNELVDQYGGPAAVRAIRFERELEATRIRISDEGEPLTCYACKEQVSQGRHAVVAMAEDYLFGGAGDQPILEDPHEAYLAELNLINVQAEDNEVVTRADGADLIVICPTCFARGIAAIAVKQIERGVS